MDDIVNPYIVGNPVTGTEMFFGREDVFDFIRRTLTGEHRDNVIILYGQRRTGKTSVLYQMRSHLDSTRYLCIFMDLHGFALESLGGFLWELANHIIRVLHRDYQIDLPRPNRVEFLADPRTLFENEFLTLVWSQIGERHILLMLDEAIRLQEQVQVGKLEHDIFEYMRHLMQHHERLNFLFSLGSGLEEMEKEYAFLFNVGLYKKISFLDLHAAHALMTQPAKDYYQVTPAAQEHMYSMTSGHPYYTQLLCHCVFYSWQQRRMSQIEVSDVDEVLSEAVERGSAVLKHVWEESTAGEKVVMVGITTGSDKHLHPVSVKTIDKVWANYGVSIPEGEKAKAIRSLIARDVIVGQDSYLFTVDLQRVWIQKHRRLEWVKEELADTVRTWLSSETPPSESNPAKTPSPGVRTVWGGSTMILMLLLLILLAGGFGWLYVLRGNTSTSPAQTPAQATATVRAIVATALAQANGNGNTTPTSIPSPGISTPQSIYNQITRGNSVLADPLSDNSKGYNWDNGNGCTFVGGTYHVSMGTAGSFLECNSNAQSANFSNFVYQVRMTIVNGDEGGIIFRYGNHSYYLFTIDIHGVYTLQLVVQNTPLRTLTTGQTHLFLAGRGQTNLLAVMADGSHFSLFVNTQYIASASDNSIALGQIGMVAKDNQSVTEVAFSYAQVWSH